MRSKPTHDSVPAPTTVYLEPVTRLRCVCISAFLYFWMLLSLWYVFENLIIYFSNLSYFESLKSLFEIEMIIIFWKIDVVKIKSSSNIWISEMKICCLEFHRWKLSVRINEKKSKFERRRCFINFGCFYLGMIFTSNLGLGFRATKAFSMAAFLVTKMSWSGLTSWWISHLVLEAKSTHATCSQGKKLWISSFSFYNNSEERG